MSTHTLRSPIDPGDATTFGAPVPRRPVAARPDPQLFPQDPTRVEPLHLRRAPLLFAAIAFCLGELLGTLHWHPPLLLTPLALLLLALAALALRHASRSPRSRSAHLVATLPVATLWLLVGTLAYHLTPAPDPQLALRPFADNLSRTVVGRVARSRLLPPPPAAISHTADAEHTWQPDVDPTPPDTPAVQPLQLDLALTRIEDVTPDTSTLVPLAGGVRLTILPPPGATEPLPAFHCGDLVEIPTRLRLPERYRDPGAWQYADYLLEQGISAHGSARAATLTRLPVGDPLGTSAEAGLGQTESAFANTNCSLFAAQSWASAHLNGLTTSSLIRRLPAPIRLSPTDTGMLSAMLFGDRSALTHQIRLGFERTGSFHLFVVSGMHVALLAGLVFTLLRGLRLRGRPLLPEAVATLLTLPLVAGYALLTGFGAPVQRALFMTSVFLLARLLSRSRSVLNALGASVLLTLLWSPHALFESSFQMTTLAIVAIAGITIPLGERFLLAPAHALRNLASLRLDASLPPRLAQFRITVRLWSDALGQSTHPAVARAAVALLRLGFAAFELALIGIVAELVMALPMSLYFHRATLFALPANLVSVPLIGILMPLSMLTFLGSLLSPWVALLPGILTASLLHLIRAAIDHFSRNPAADLRVPAPSALVVAGVVGCLAFCCWAARRSRRWAAVAALALPLATLATLWPEPMVRAPGVLELTAIDVGQGDSILLVGAEGRTMLIDAGGPTGSILEAATATSLFDVGEEVVAPYLWSRRIRRLDTLVLSHAHSDHMGGMPAVLRDLRPRELWVSIPAHAQAFQDLLAQAKAQGTTIRFLHAGENLTWGDEQVHVLSPDPAYGNPGDPRNDDSLVLRVNYRQASVLLEGDAEAPSEQGMLAAGRLSPVSVLKVGHHGSLTSTTPEFLAATRPAAAVISTGLGNRFGHPRPAILQRLQQQNVKTARTDLFGLTTFQISPSGTITTPPLF